MKKQIQEKLIEKHFPKIIARMVSSLIFEILLVILIIRVSLSKKRRKSVSPIDTKKFLESFDPRKIDIENDQYKSNRKMKSFDLAVIVPVFNGEKDIERAVQSVLGQSTKYSFACIIVDDGSTDSTSSKIAKFSKNSHVFIIEKENGGISSARNAGINFVLAQTKYILFLDGDDYLSEKNSIDVLMSKATDQNSDMVDGSYQLVMGNSVSEKKLNNIDLVDGIAYFNDFLTLSMGKSNEI